MTVVAARLKRRPLPTGPTTLELHRQLLAGAITGVIVLVFAAVLLFDAASVPWARGLPHGVAALFGRITRFGQSDWLLIPSGVLVLLLLTADWRRVPPLIRRAWAEIGALVGAFFVAIAIAGLLTDLVKWIVGRSRPMLFASDGILSFHPFLAGYPHVSFPSGHATTVTAATVVIGLISRRAAIPVGIAAALIGLSRVVVGAHYPSDVIAGAFVGGTYAYGLATWLVGKRVAFRRDRAGRIRPRIAALRRAAAAPGMPRRLLAALVTAVGDGLAPRRRAPS
jgi:undecaprenyl-diphosphatase